MISCLRAKFVTKRVIEKRHGKWEKEKKKLLANE
jgi:hypothetical protein